MAITFLDEEEDIVAAAKPPKVKGGVTFLDEEEPLTEEAIKPEPEVLTTPSGRKITFLDEEPTPSGGLGIPPSPEPLPPKPPEESFLRPLADPLLNIGAGINDVLKGFTDAFGADNAVSQNLAKNSEWYRDLLSAGAKQDQEEIGRIMQEAEGQGVLAEIGAGLKALSVAPIDLVSQGIGSLIPFIATAGVGKALGLSKAGVAVLQGVQGGVVGGGIVKGEIYDAVKDQLINSGVDEGKAEKAAQEAQAYNGKNLDQILLGTGLGVAASTTGADSAIRKLIAQKVGKKAAEEVSEQAVQEVLRTGFVRGGAKGAAVEFTTEGLQGGQEKLAANIAVGREGFDVDPMRGVVAQGTLEGSIGAILGGGVSGISAKVEQMDVRKKVALRDAQKAAEEAKQSNAPASAAAVEEQIEQVGETLNIPATVTPRREGETDQQWRARIEQERAETPDQRVARLQREAQEGVDIELEEEVPVSGLPPVSELPPVKKGFVRLYHGGAAETAGEFTPYLDTALGYAQQSNGSIFYIDVPEDSEFLRRGDYDEQGNISERGILSSRQSRVPDGIALTAKRAASGFEAQPVTPTPAVGVAGTTASVPVMITRKMEADLLSRGLTQEQINAMTPQEANDMLAQPAPTAAPVEPTPVTPTPVTPEVTRKADQGIVDRIVKESPVEESNTFGGNAVTIKLTDPETGGYLTVVDRQDGTPVSVIYFEVPKEQRQKGVGMALQARALKEFPNMRGQVSSKSAARSAYALGRRPINNPNATLDETLALIDEYSSVNMQAPTPEPPALAPLRRVVKAEQTEDDVSGLVGQGLVELYNGQPVITQAGLEALPENERPRLTPEARKIQIDTGSNEVVAEAISKGLRFGIDQVPPTFKMPEGWTLDGDIYIPPVRTTPEEVARIAEQYGVDEKTATSIFNNEVFRVPAEMSQGEQSALSGFFFERYNMRLYAIPVGVVKKRLAAQAELGRLSTLERAALSGMLTEQRLLNEDDAKRYIRKAGTQGFTADEIAAATPAAEAKWNERFPDNGNAREVAGDVSPPIADFAAEEAASASQTIASESLPSSKLFDLTAREALRYIAGLNLGAQLKTAEGRVLTEAQILRRAASVLAKLPLRILDADFIKKARGGDRAYRANEGFIRVPATSGGQEFLVSIRTIIHEVAHTLTADAFRKYVADRSRHVRGKNYLNALDKALASPDTPDQVKRAISLYKQTLDELGLTNEYFRDGGLADLDPTYSMNKAVARKIPLINKFTGKAFTSSEFYALANLDEFVAQTWSSIEFQDLLKNIKVKNQPSIYERFVRLVRDLFGFESDTMAAAVIDATNSLAELEAPSRGATVQERIDANLRAGMDVATPAMPTSVEIRESRREPAPTFTEESPEAKTLSNLKASMEKVDAASEAKGGKPETQKVSEIAANWMEQGGDERALQDAITENTNLSPVNAAKVAKVIAKQYGLQQQIAETGAVIAEITPEAEGAPRKSSVTKLIEQTTGVRKPVVKLQVSESAALKKQIQLKAREARETRKARKEAAEDLAKSITDYVKANPIRGPINSRQAMSITKRALKLDVNNEAAVDRFEMYVERVIENANYDQDLADARALIKRAKAFAKSKDTQGNVKTTLDAIANISPTLLDNPFEFNLVVQRYLLGLAPVTAKQYAVMPDADVRRYLESLETQISANQDVLDRSKAQRILDRQAAYADEKGIPLDEAISILNSEEFLNEKTIEKLEDLTKLLTSMAQESQKDVRAYDETGATPKQKELISFMGKVNLDSLTNEEKKRYIRFSNNLLANGATFGMEQFQSIALGQESAIKALKDKRLSNKLAAWISPIGGDRAIDTARKIALRTQSEADTFKNIFGREAVGVFRNILGLNRLDVAQTDSNRAKEQIANEFGEYFKGLRKKYGNDATGFEAKGYAGIAGYLIQTDGIKTEAESIPYRRRLMEQNIVELRKSDKRADLAEADLKERALAQLTGTSNAEIMSQLQALNPASYEQLMWVKDVMLPKWRDFLKEHDENFRNQANNYNNPDHLTITYKFPEGQLLPNEIEDVYQQDAIGMRIKQAANSIKRKEHSNLPVSPRTGTVANIDINFGYNQYNALVDQVDKAFVAPAWEQVVAFTKAPEFEQVMGGRANSLFVKKLLTDIQTSRTRQSMTDDEAQMVAGGVRLARKISTQAVLGGFTQPLRQVPDQLTKLFLTTGRWDLITKNLLRIAEAAPLLNKFPIGRRGDAQAGTQYASQFSELARKVEASVTDRKWAQYRELMNRVGEFWMAPLRGSDVWAAKVSWMSYYEAELNKNGIKMESWEREAELVETDDARKEAASYAEFAVDFYGGASDPTKMASLSKQTNNGWKEFAKLLFLPLNSFALQQKNSLISDLRDAYLRTGDRKASIAAIAGTLAGMAAFHGMRIYIIGGLLYPAGKALLMGIFGIDMDEPDEEEKQKKLEDDWRKFKASMYGNIVAGGAGEFAEKAAIDAVNRTAYLWDANINPDSLLNDKGEIMSFRQYEKEVSPLYRFRSYGSSEYSFGLADVLTEQATHSLAETQQLLTPEEMERYTGNEQAYAAFATGVEWMYFFRLMDTDVKRIATDLKRQMDKQVEEREKYIKSIRSGR